MIKYWIALGLGAAMLYAPSASAAPFCVQLQGVPPECHYDDAAQCRRRAVELKGLCVVNKAEINVTAGSGKYCLVDSNRVVQCIYIDRNSCDAEARKSNAACIDAPIETIQEDPYRFDPNRKY